MRITVAALVAAIAMTGCSGGGGSTPKPQPTPTPTTTASANGANHLAGAPATIYAPSGAQSLSRKTAQSIHTKSVNLGTGGVPTVVVGYNPTMGAIFSQLYVWVENAQNQPVQETNLTATATGPLTIQDVSLDNANAFSLTYFDWIINPGVLSGTGKIEITATFGDGTTGQVPYYSYDKWNLTCGVATPGDPSQWGYVSGIPVGDTSTDDVSIDCINGAVDFPNGARLISAAAADSYGNLATQMTSVLSASLSGTTLTAVPFASLNVGDIYLVKLSDGGYAKFMPLQAFGLSITSGFGISLHDSPSGSGAFPF